MDEDVEIIGVRGSKKIKTDSTNNSVPSTWPYSIPQSFGNGVYPGMFYGGFGS